MSSEGEDGGGKSTNQTVKAENTRNTNQETLVKGESGKMYQAVKSGLFDFE